MYAFVFGIYLMHKCFWEFSQFSLEPPTKSLLKFIPRLPTQPKKKCSNVYETMVQQEKATKTKKK